LKALDALLQSWKERLSLITVISTFFAATEAQLISGITPNNPRNTTAVQSAADAGLSGALVIHIFAALISFLAAFLLIQYQLCEAVVQENQVGHATKLPASGTTTVATEMGVFTADPHLEHRGPFGLPTPPISLLRKCNSLCMWLTAIGAVLALMGVICSTWSTMPESVSIFTSACAGFCVVVAIYAFT